MRKSIIFLSILILFGILNFISAEIRINEVELNPPGSSDAGNEWIELYSNNEVNLTNWVLISTNGRNITFNATFSGYYFINTSRNFLTDSENTITLEDKDKNKIFYTKSLSDKNNDARTWQYCSEDWTFVEATFDNANSCDTEDSIVLINTDTQDNKNDSKPKTIQIPVINESNTPNEVPEVYSEPEVILLGSSEPNKDDKSPKIDNSIIYKSKTEYIKQYIPYGFSLMCVLIIILLLIDRKQKKVSE